MEMLGLKRFAVGQVILMRALSAMRMFLDEKFFLSDFHQYHRKAQVFLRKGKRLHHQHRF